MKTLLASSLLLSCTLTAHANVCGSVACAHEACASYSCADTTRNAAPDTVPHRRRPLLKRVAGSLLRFVRNFSDVDTAYIEPQKFNYTVMLQNTNTYEIYSLSPEPDNKLRFSPLPSIKVGPYVGWRWLFLGYTLDIKHISNGDKKKEFDLSLYSSQIGVDLFYRKTGNDYKISYASFGRDGQIDTKPLVGADYDGINVGIKGFNIYYIFNHRRFSYPAAFSQSTIQRRSCGSALCGIGYTRHSLSIDWDKLHSLTASRLGQAVADEFVRRDANISSVKYTDVSVSGGYAYNWVFAHNWLAAASVSMAVGYKGSTGNSEGTEKSEFSFRNFSFHNLNIDGIGRFGVVWNNMRWYGGMSAILHSYNYRKSKFYTNTMFGSLNFYLGVNIGRIRRN